MIMDQTNAWAMNELSFAVMGNNICDATWGEEGKEDGEGNGRLLWRAVLCQVVAEGEAAPPLDWTFIPLSGYRILWWQPQPYLRIDGWGRGRLWRPDLPPYGDGSVSTRGSWICHLPEVGSNLPDQLGSKTICGLMKNENSAILGLETIFHDICLWCKLQGQITSSSRSRRMQ